MTGSAREALIAEALGDVARLLDRVETMASSMDQTRQALSDANAQLLHRMITFEAHMSAITEVARTRAVEHVARRTDEAARCSLEKQSIAMTQAAQSIFRTELSPALQRFLTALQPLVIRADRLERLRDRWLAHAATAALTCAAGVSLTAYWLIG